MFKVLLTILMTFSTLIFASSSEEERANKKFELSIQQGIDYRMSTTQASAMYFFNSHNLAGIKIGNRTGHEKQTNITAQYKLYLGNSFYLAPEIFYLNSREEVNGYLSSLFMKTQNYASYSSMGGGLRIGNQWSWKNFTLGCDWIGIGQRVGTFKKESSKLNDTTYTFLNLFVGINF